MDFIFRKKNAQFFPELGGSLLIELLRYDWNPNYELAFELIKYLGIKTPIGLERLEAHFSSLFSIYLKFSQIIG